MEYNSSDDLVEGYEDLGELGRRNRIGNSALVVLVRGLHHNWRIPLGYFVSKGPVAAILLKDIIKIVMLKLIQMSFEPMALVCDQASNNRKALILLGATLNSPKIDIGGFTIYTVYDAPHLVKSLRNNLMNTKLQIVVNGRRVSWNDIVETYSIDKKSMTARTLIKINDSHIRPNTFEKMRVKYATQIFSHTVAAAIRTCVHTGQLVSYSANDTANFVENVNNVFDSLNSKTLRDPNSRRRPLSVFGQPVVRETLESGIKMFQNVVVYENGKKRNNIYCIDGFVWTLRSILLLWDDLRNKGSKYLVTSFLNQDPLENFFSVIRSRCGYNPTPSVRQCRIAIQQNMNIRLLQSLDSGNCELADGEMLNLHVDDDDFTAENVLSNKDENAHNTTPDEDIEVGSGSLKPTTPESLTDPTEDLETSAHVYVAGYLAYKAKKKFNCAPCSDLFEKGLDEEIQANEYFILYKEYNFAKFENPTLKRPSIHFHTLVSDILKEFNIVFDVYKYKVGVKRNIREHLGNIIKSKHPWFNECQSQECCVHRGYIIDLFIKMKMFHTLKWETTNMTRKKLPDKPHRKIRILS